MWPWKRGASAGSRKKLSAFLDEGSEIEGKYTFTGTVLLNGKFQGEIASPDTLIIGERVELAGKARVFGDLESPIVVLEEGVMFEGHCRMPRPGASEPNREAAVVPLKRS
jgi:cytoskeletal protein CcmA (bactofilin family)